MSRAEEEKENAAQGAGRQIYYFNSFFYAKLSGQGYEAGKLKRWTKKVCLLSLFAKETVR